jgi:lipopolysaccharide export system permease protein
VFMFILMMQSFWLYLDELLGRGLEWYVILEFLIYASASLVEFALPLAILLSSTMALGNLAENNELVAIKSTGISFLRSSRSLVVVVFFISIVAFFFSNSLSPLAAFKMQVLRADILNKKPTFALKENTFYTQIDGLSIRIGSKKDNYIEDVTIYQYPLKGSENNKRLMPNSSNRSEKKSIRAKRGKMVMFEEKNLLVLQLEHGEIYEEVDETAFKQTALPFQRYKFEKTTLSIPLEGFDLQRSSKDDYAVIYKFLTLNQLNAERDSTEKKIRSIKQAFVEEIHTPLVDTLSKHLEVDYSFTNLPKEVQKRNIVNATEQMRVKIHSISSKKIVLEANQSQLARIDVEKHRKFVLPLACIILFFIGAPMGAIVKKGGLGMPVVITVVFFLIYFIFTTIGEEMASEGALTPFVGMWLSSFILAPIAVFLTYKANNDSKLFDRDFYLKLLKLKK